MCSLCQAFDIFSRYNEGELKSYLISITSKVLAEKNPYAPGSLVDDIKDSAGQKGTGKWTAISGFNLGVDLSLIDSACNCRFSSAEPEVRSLREDAFVKPISVNIDKEELKLILDSEPEKELNIYADMQTPFQSFVDVVDVAKIKRDGRFSITTKKE